MDKNSSAKEETSCATIRISCDTHAMIKEVSRRTGMKVWRVANDLLKEALEKKLTALGAAN